MQVYHASVSNTTRIGTSVGIFGVDGIVEGMAHISNHSSQGTCFLFETGSQCMQVYRGRVSNTTRIGAFVELFGVAGKVEGMVHISNLSSRRVSDVSEVASRGDEVWVKVLSIQEPKPGQTRPRIELSMRDVDQSTGEDLLPLHGGAGGAVGVLPGLACGAFGLRIKCCMNS